MSKTSQTTLWLWFRYTVSVAFNLYRLKFALKLNSLASLHCESLSFTWEHSQPSRVRQAKFLALSLSLFASGALKRPSRPTAERPWRLLSFYVFYRLQSNWIDSYRFSHFIRLTLSATLFPCVLSADAAAPPSVQPSPASAVVAHQTSRCSLKSCQ